ncbi:hypothetical protein [Actinophytocola sp.]|uniref:hypothetical protein n=1 Tax=Actinophytocola sp. TaxID=1872138 RepID=UPI002D7EA34F|nr:hypothetical protein [Actinophytocola sp.]HET9138742.1 hypothetical protein [Actinophytocola sp.]
MVGAEPALLAEIYETARRRAVAEDRARLFDAAATVAVDFGQAVEGAGPGIGLVTKHLAAGRLVYPKVRAALGGRCTAVVCAGEPPDPRLRHFFRGIGVAVHSV